MYFNKIKLLKDFKNLVI